MSEVMIRSFIMDVLGGSTLPDIGPYQPSVDLPLIETDGCFFLNHINIQIIMDVCVSSNNACHITSRKITIICKAGCDICTSADPSAEHTLCRSALDDAISAP